MDYTPDIAPPGRSDDQLSGTNRLVAAVITDAWKDIDRVPETIRVEDFVSAVRFFMSPKGGLEWYAPIVDLDPDVVRERVLETINAHPLKRRRAEETLQACMP